MKWDEAAVEASIRALPMRTDGKAPDVGEMVAKIRIGVWASQGNASARARNATRKQTLAELRKLCDLCRDLYEHIEQQMHSPALRMVEDQIRSSSEARKAQGQRPLYHPLLLNTQLEGLYAAARAAWVDAKNGGELPQPENGGSKPGATMLTQVCASVYESVTGEKPSRKSDAYEPGQKERGEFAKFLGAMFVALGVDAKPAGQVQTYLKKRRQKQA